MAKRDARPAGPRPDPDLPTRRDWLKAVGGTPGLGGAAYQVAIDLFSWMNADLTCFRSQGDMAAATGVSKEETVSKAVKRLIAAGALRVATDAERSAYDAEVKAKGGRLSSHETGREATTYVGVLPDAVSPVQAGETSKPSSPPSSGGNERVVSPVQAGGVPPVQTGAIIDRLKCAGAQMRAPALISDPDLSESRLHKDTRAPLGAGAFAPDLNDQTEPGFDAEGVRFLNAADMEGPPDYRPPDWPQDHVSADLPPGAICGPLALPCFDFAFRAFGAIDEENGIALASPSGFAARFWRGYVLGDCDDAEGVVDDIAAELLRLGTHEGNRRWPTHGYDVREFAVDCGASPTTADRAVAEYVGDVRSRIAQATKRRKEAGHAVAAL